MVAAKPPIGTFPAPRPSVPTMMLAVTNLHPSDGYGGQAVFSVSPLASGVGGLGPADFRAGPQDIGCVRRYDQIMDRDIRKAIGACTRMRSRKSRQVSPRLAEVLGFHNLRAAAARKQTLGRAGFGRVGGKAGIEGIGYNRHGWPGGLCVGFSSISGHENPVCETASRTQPA